MAIRNDVDKNTGATNAAKIIINDAEIKGLLFFKGLI